MAIKRITLEGFKNLQKFSIDLGANANYVLAANGVGKSTIADALSFTYCNTDRFGNVKPLHLIKQIIHSIHAVSCPPSLVYIFISKKVKETIRMFTKNTSQ